MIDSRLGSFSCGRQTRRPLAKLSAVCFVGCAFRGIEPGSRFKVLKCHRFTVYALGLKDAVPMFQPTARPRSRVFVWIQSSDH